MMMILRTPLAIYRTEFLTLAIGVVVCTGTGCHKQNDAGGQGGSSDTRPDVLPVMLNKDLPFRYPPALYAEKTQGNVTLRLYINKDGNVVAESTHVAESSRVTAFDSAAIKGARELRFVPAKLDGAPMPVSILFPVYFRHPEAAPPSGDTVLKKIAPATTPPVPAKK